MKIHEYQAKQLMAERGIAVPAGTVATTVDEAVAAVRPLVEQSGNPVVVVKSQIHAGGRGKGRFKEHPEVGGVNVVLDGIQGGIEATESKVRELAELMLGSTLVTIQTGDEGKRVNRLYIEQGIDIERELYLSILLDRSVGRNIVMASTEGGVEIERVAEETPEKILREVIDPAIGLAGFQAARLALGLGLDGEAGKNFIRFVSALAEAAEGWDTDLIEINPLVVTTDGAVMALDGKMAFDDNALFGIPMSPRCGMSPKRTPLSSRRRSPDSRISPSMERSAVSSMAQGWRWRRWTRSSMSVANRPTSSTSEEALTPNRWRRRSASSRRIPM
jgi:succinyl-CoA synthetase beta subunit